MQFSVGSVLLAALGILSAVTKVQGFRQPPYCTPTGPNHCNLGWEYDSDIVKTHIWVYNKNCHTLGDTDYFGWWENIMKNDLPGTLWVHSFRDGPDFTYRGKAYSKKGCWYMQGPRYWIYASQCAFECPDTNPLGLWRGGKRDRINGTDEVAYVGTPLNLTEIDESMKAAGFMDYDTFFNVTKENPEGNINMRKLAEKEFNA